MPARRKEGRYKVLIGGRLACLYWTGATWQMPRSVYTRRTPPEGAVAAAKPVEWQDEWDSSLGANSPG